MVEVTVSTYGDLHRVFLQGMMSRGIAGGKDIKELFQTAYEQSQGPELDFENKDIYVKALVDTIKTINKELDSLGMAIVKAIDEDYAMRGQHTYYVLVNRDDHDVGEKLAFKAMPDFAPFELEYTRHLVDHIMDEEERQIEAISALHLAKLVKAKKMKQSEGEATLDKLVAKKWLKRNEDGNGFIRLAPRFIAEMGDFLDRRYRIEKCYMCPGARGSGKRVIRPVVCSDCGQHYHRYCIKSDACPNKKCRGKVQDGAGRKRRHARSDSEEEDSN